MTPLRLIYVSSASLLLAVGAAGPAAASSLIFPSTGAKGMSMAGAWIAQGDDVQVLDHNPAQLVRQRQYAGEVHYTGFLYQGEFDAAPAPGVGDPLPAENTADAWRHIPNAFGAIPIGEDWTIGVGIFSPIGPAHQYASEGGQRYQLMQARLNLAWGSAHVAWRPVSAVAISAGVDVAYAWANQKIAIGLVPGFRSLDGYVEVDGASSLIPRPKFGAVVWLTDEWTLGLVGATGVELSVSGDVIASVPQAGIYADDPGSRDQVSASQWYPAEGRIGIGYHGEAFRAEFGGRYYHWSAYTQQFIDLEKEVVAGFEFGDITIPKSFNNSVAFHAGGGYRFLDRHEVRAGYLFDQAAAEDDYLVINDLDTDRHTVGVGYGAEWKHVYFNIAYNHYFFHDRTITDGKHEAIAVLGDTPVSNNGTFTWGVNTVALSLGGRF